MIQEALNLYLKERDKRTDSIEKDVKFAIEESFRAGYRYGQADLWELAQATVTAKKESGELGSTSPGATKERLFP